MLRECRVHVQPGQGVVACFGDAVAVAVASSPSQERFLDELLATVEAAAGAEGRAPGRRIARRLAGMLGTADPDDAPDFCVLAQADSGVAVLVNGAIDVAVTGADGSLELSGRDVATWVDRIVSSPFDLVTIAPSATTPPAVDPRSDLRSGVVRGGGAVLVARGSRAPDPAPGPAEEPTILTMAADPRPAEPAPPEPPPPTSLEVDGTGPAPEPEPEPEPEDDLIVVSFTDPVPDEPARPLPIAGEPPAPGAAEVDGPVIEGILCSRAHFNDPSALFCSSCGISMVHQTHNAVRGPRPPLGVLVLDDGATFVLDGNYTIGREPESDQEVRETRARPLLVADPERSISRVHARIVLEGWDVKVVDAGSANGTYVAAPGESEWTRLPPREPRTIRPGTRILVGRRPLIFESHHRV